MYTDQDRPRKRKHQLYLRERLQKKDYGHGTIVVLCGPNPKKAVKYHKNLYKKCILVENDKDTYYKAKKIHKTMDQESIKLRYENVFDVVRNRNDKITGVDFDFCTTLNNKLYFQILDALEPLVQNKIWVRITTSYRKMPKRKLDAKKQFLKQYLEEYSGYKVIDEVSIGYRDTSPMDVWQIQLERK